LYHEGIAKATTIPWKKCMLSYKNLIQTTITHLPMEILLNQIFIRPQIKHYLHSPVDNHSSFTNNYGVTNPASSSNDLPSTYKSGQHDDIPIVKTVNDNVKYTPTPNSDAKDLFPPL
jgi:hypothetical protein